jgi:hypothetical protein
MTEGTNCTTVEIRSTALVQNKCGGSKVSERKRGMQFFWQSLSMNGQHFILCRTIDLHYKILAIAAFFVGSWD